MTMRKYQPLWNKLKADGIVTIAAPVANHDTIIAMVKKERNKDLGFSLLCSENYIKYRLSNRTSVKTGVLTIKLNRTYPRTTGNL